MFLFASLSLASAFAGGPAHAQFWPERPVRIIVGQPPGNPADVAARILAPALSDRLGKPFIVENQPGAAQNAAAEAVIRSAPDGYMLLVATLGNAANASLYPNLKFVFTRDTTPIAALAILANVMVVAPTFPAADVPAFIAKAKAEPGKLGMASTGVGTTPHLAGELFASMAGVSLRHVAYASTSQAQIALMSGNIDVMFDTLGSTINPVRDGKLRALGVTSANRSPALITTPAINETVSGYEASSWFGLVGPAALPAGVVARLNQAVSGILAESMLGQRLGAVGMAPLLMPPADFGKFVARETEKWSGVVKARNIRPD